MVKFELGGEEEKRDRREGRGGEVDGTTAMDSSVSSSVSRRVQRPTVPAFTQLTISSKCLHAYSRVCLMEHSYLVPVHCHMGIVFHYQPWGLELFWLTWGSSLWRTLALLLPSCSMGKTLQSRNCHTFFSQYILVGYIQGLHLNN